MSWFTSTNTVPEIPKAIGKAPAFFDIRDEGASKIVTFLDPDPDGEKVGLPPLVNVHKIFAFADSKDKFPSYVLCPRSDGKENKLQDYCDTLDKESDEYKAMCSKQMYCFTVLVEGDEKEDGTRYPHSRQIRLTNLRQAQKYVERVDSAKKKGGRGALKDVNGLCGHTFYIDRPDEDFIPRIGIIGEYIETPEDLTNLHENPTPFTTNELLERFVADVDSLNAYFDREIAPKLNTKIATGKVKRS